MLGSAMARGCHADTETTRHVRGKETRAHGMNAHRWSVQPPRVGSLQPCPPMPPAQGQALLPTPAPPAAEGDSRVCSPPAPWPSGGAGWEGTSIALTRGPPQPPLQPSPPSPSARAWQAVLGAKSMNGICPKSKCNPLYVGSMATTPHQPPHEHLVGATQPTQGHPPGPSMGTQSCFLSNRSGPQPQPCHQPKCFEGAVQRPPPPALKGSRRQLDPWGKASQGRHSPTVLLWDIGTDPVLGTQEAISHGAR